MNVFVIVTPYLKTGFFGTYSTMKRARIVLEDFLSSDENITNFEDCGDYRYHFMTKSGEQFYAEILWDVIDAEFIEGVIKDE